MFKRSFFLSITLITLTGIAIYWFNVRVGVQDVPDYHNLVQRSSDLRARRALEQKPTFQTRQGVQKDIWTQNQTHHFKIRSEYSEIAFSQKNGKMEAVETLKNLILENDFILTADEGIYSFPPHQFMAQNNCHLVHRENLIDGTRIYIDLASEILTYDNPHGILKTGLEFTARQLIWNKKENKIYLHDNVVIHDAEQSTLTANKGVLTLNEFEPTLLELFDDVHMISKKIDEKESYAIADHLTFNPSDKSILLTSKSKVLFWQEGLSLRAAEVYIQQNQKVEGRGNVHFSFDLEEQNYIKELLKHYL